MPELPEVEAARAVVRDVLQGRVIAAVDAVADPIVFVGTTPRALKRALVGATVTDVGRKGKHLWLELDRRPWLALHLGMTGSLRAAPEPGALSRAWKLVLSADDGGRLVFNDPRRFGRVRLQPDPPHEAPISLLGPDPLEGLPTAAALHAMLQKRSRAVKPLLLDQALFAGIGNWIADEVLYQAALSPHRIASSLTLADVRRLRASILTVIRTAVAADADARRFPKDWLFHHRWSRSRAPEQPAGRANRKRSARPEGLVRETIGGRTAAWDPARQR